MILFHNTIKNTKYAWELAMFHKLRNFEDGMTFFDFTCEWDRFVADHKPSFQFMLVLVNYTIFEFNIYNIYHENDPEYYS